MGIVIAWGAGLGIITYRWARHGAPPTPGTLALASGFFALCALLGEYPPARTTATMLALGVDLAALLQVLGKAPAGQVTGWPPPMINDPTALMPPGNAAGTAGGSTGAGGGGGKKWNIWTGTL